MNLFEEKYSPSEFADKIGATTDNLRDWRRRGLDIGLSAAVNGRKTYSDYDLFEVELMRALKVDCLDEMRGAIDVARWIAPNVLKRFGISCANHPMVGWVKQAGHDEKRFYLVNGLGNVRMADDVSDALQDWGDHVGFRVIDCEAAARRIAGWVVTELCEYRMDPNILP